MTLAFHGPWQAWAWYIGGSAMFMLAVVLAALLFADLLTRFEATLSNSPDQ